jgi:biopolymer transport protein ExbD
MKLRRNKLLVEPPAGASSDIAFILIVFFLVCASVQPEQGRPQEIPKSEETTDKKDQSQNPRVELFRTEIKLDEKEISKNELGPNLTNKLDNVTGHKVVVLNSEKDVSYERWIEITGIIEKVGGIVTLEIKEERTVGFD